MVLVLLLFLATPASGYRREYRVLLDGERMQGSEVCFYQGKSAADAFSLYFSYDRVACLPADDVLDMPPGLFHVFARHPSGYVSADRDYFVYRGAPAPEVGYSLLDIPLRAAALADFGALARSLKPRESLGVWVAPSSNSSGTFFPLVDNESVLMVPAGIPFLPLLIKDHRPEGVGSPMTLAANELGTIPAFPTPSGRSDVMLALRLDSSVPIQDESALQLPEITLVAQDRTFAHTFELHHPLGVTNTLLFFKDVPTGPARIQVRGKTWVHSEMLIDVAGGGTTVWAEPLLLVPGATLTVSWSARSGDIRPKECGGSTAARAALQATLSKCNQENSGGTKCTVIATKAIPYETSGSLSFEGVRAGTYRLAVVPPFANLRSMPVELAAGQETPLELAFDTFAFFGTVMLNGEPLEARLIFESGETESDEAGMYTAALAANPLTNLVRIVPCDGTRVLTYIPREPVIRNSAYNIDLRTRTLVVRAVDPNGRPVADVPLRYSPIKKEISAGHYERYYSSPTKLTDANGEVTFDDVSVSVAIIFCPEHRDYLQKCTEPFTFEQLATNKAVVRLQPNTFTGRVVGHEGFAVLGWVDGSGRITEQVRVETDGTFAYERQHGSGEHAVYASNKRALTVFRPPSSAQGSSELIINLPNAPARSFRVTVPRAPRAGFIGLWVGGMYVPLQLLAIHQEMRGLDVMVYPEQSLLIKDVAESAALEVAFAPELLQPMPGFVDPFTLPEYALTRRYPVLQSDVTVEP
ncbi:MAG: hypothetical protein ACYC7A_18845 [Thermoanaerobaculia bacterium]